MKLSVNLYRSMLKVKKALVTDWNKFIDFYDHPEKISYEIQRIKKQKNIKAHHNGYLQDYETLQKQIQSLKNIHQYKKSKEIIHAILYVTYKEPYHLIRESIKSYVESKYAASRIILVFAGEESDRANFLDISEKIEKEFGKYFMKFIQTVHPNNIPGEIKGKSANSTYAAKRLKKYLDGIEIDYENVMISVFDADTVVHPQYFNELTFKYLITERRWEKAYQPTHMFHNNIWDVPMMIRMVALSCTFWRMAESMEKEKYKSFSSRSLSFKTIVDVDYWDPSTIPEDSRQYWTAYTVYQGRHRLVPIYSPVYMDAVLADTYVKTFKNQYNQLRRWAWGVCDFPFVFLNLQRNKGINFFKKMYLIAEFLKNNLLWSTGPFLLTFMGFLPGLLNVGFRETVLAYNLPRMMSNILTLASVGIVISTIISFIIIPKKPRQNLWGKFLLSVQWLFIPAVSIFLSAIPALDAQTRLLFGKYLEYKVTEKVRRKKVFIEKALSH